MTGHGGVSCQVAPGWRLVGAAAVGRRTKPARSIYTPSRHLVMILAEAACQCFVIYKRRGPWRGKRERRGLTQHQAALQTTLSLQNKPRAARQRGHQTTKLTQPAHGCEPPRAFAEEQSKLLAWSWTSSISRGPGATHQSLLMPRVACSPVCTAAPSTEPTAGPSASLLNETPPAPSQIHPKYVAPPHRSKPSDEG